MPTVTIIPTQDLFNSGKCFTKGEEYVVNTHYRNVTTPANLMDLEATNDLNEPHRIGGWWRYFKIVKPSF